MYEISSTSLVEWSRWQFAMTAIYHYMFVPLTLGLSFLIAIMETIWVRTGKEEWLKATKFWMKLFGINFAIGVATGLILEFQFGSNWSNYSWFVGDIFGAPLAIEGLLAFFLEATFVAVMFFGWNKVSRRFHLLSTWMVFIGSNISALWILVANAWMQNPVGMEFNPFTARNEMDDFWSVLLSPTAVSKFFHTVTSAYTLSACFVIGVSTWFILKKKQLDLARQSILLASVFGIWSILVTMFSGDTSAQDVAKTQPMKFAAMEGLNEGGKNMELTVIGILQEHPDPSKQHLKTTTMKVAFPGMLSFLAYRTTDAYIPGIQNILDGYTSETGEVFPPVRQRMENGRLAIEALRNYKQAIEIKDEEAAASALSTLKTNYPDFGYGYLQSEYESIPHIPLVFYCFRIMVGLGFLFMTLFIISWWYARKRQFEKFKFIPYVAIICVPLAYIASQCGWVVAEVGRQPWVVQDLLPTSAAVTRIASPWVVTTFWMFAVLFTILLIAELKIMFTQIKKEAK
ncbi:cytochrome ubiquinol oxidase subunit I [Odoribacter lunatus]|uniref:cytochrome ubiquinol oxidase subunit I n=1 Tax=Odoribacter lunatus TaxID=2941335 RepID=UPI003B96CE36